MSQALFLSSDFPNFAYLNTPCVLYSVPKMLPFYEPESGWCRVLVIPREVPELLSISQELATYLFINLQFSLFAFYWNCLIIFHRGYAQDVISTDRNQYQEIIEEGKDLPTLR